MANKVQFGLSNVHVALVKTGVGGAITYDKPHAIAGAVNLTIEPNGSVTPFYADNIIFFQAASNQGYTGTLEVALLDDWFLMNVLKFIKDEKGVLYEDSDASPAPIALLYQVEGDEKAAKRVLYYVQVTRGSQTAATKTDTVEPQTTTLNITVAPSPDTHNIKANTTPDTDSATYEGWFENVYIPSGTFPQA